MSLFVFVSLFVMSVTKFTLNETLFLITQGLFFEKLYFMPKENNVNSGALSYAKWKLLTSVLLCKQYI